MVSAHTDKPAMILYSSRVHQWFILKAQIYGANKGVHCNRCGTTSLQEPEQELPQFEIQHVINILSLHWG